MRRWVITALVLFSTSAQAASPSDLVGDWRWLASPSQEAAISRGVERAVGAFNLFLRPVVRMQLEPVAVPHRLVELRVVKNSVTFTEHVNGKVSSSTRVLGSREVADKTVDGDPMWTTTLFEDGVLKRTERTAEGGRTVRYSLTAAGALELGVEFFSEQLPESLRYTLSYERRD